MTALRFTLSLLASFTLLLPTTHGADDPRLATLQAADDERVAALLAASAPRLTAILSEDLRYAHSNGLVDSRDSMIATLTSGKTRYTSWTYTQRQFSFPTPNIALMTGQTKATLLKGSESTNLTLNFLGVWREEKGQWHFLAWQSSRAPEPSTPIPKAP
ncbi:MAG: nuclear transport factor 2 family protein [Verrucomicrobia bacterium]|nr:nuclear transport factor 2 family protein [Verrucomicrobiota bacterium]